jgi:hypothetical protein
LYEVEGVARHLDDWAKTSHISKTTLFHRVVKCGMAMDAALAMGKGDQGEAPAHCGTSSAVRF